MEVSATRTGLISYMNRDGSIRRELRIAEEVFKPESLETLKGIPVTDEHPPEGLLTSENTKDFQRGHTHDEVKQDGDYVVTKATVTDKSLIEKIMNGRLEVSCGYKCDLEEVPAGSKFDGIEYHGIQRNIRYNHLASTSRGRAGPFARFRLDGMIEVLEENVANRKEARMYEVTIEGVTYKLEDQGLAKTIAEKLRSDSKIADDLKAELAAAQTKLDSASAENETLKGRCDGLDAKVTELETASQTRTDSDEEIHTKVIERQRICQVAEGVLSDEVKLDSMSNEAIVKEVVLAKMPEMAERADSLTGPYLQGIFDTIAANKAESTVSELGKTVIKTDSASNGGDLRAKMIAASKNLYRGEE